MKSLLAFFSAPAQSSNIVQAMVIQSHQPDIIVQIEADIQGQAKIEPQRPFLEKWLEGGDALLDLYPDLNQPFEVPHTPPKGYMAGGRSKIPKLVKINMGDMEILQVLKNIERDFPEHEYIFDLLPGAKLLKIDLLLRDDNRWKQTYTLDNGGFLEFGKQGVVTNDGQFLSIIDRTWLAGFPIHVSMTMEEIRSKQDFYSMVMESCYIETVSDEELKKTEAKKRTFTKEKIKEIKTDRPISFRSDIFVERFHSKGGQVLNQRPEGIDLKGPNGEFWRIEFFQNTFANGVPFESLVANEISKAWNCDEVLQGVSIIQPSSDLREASFKNLSKLQQQKFLDHPELEHETGPFIMSCEALGLSVDTPLEELISSDFERLNKSDDDDEKLKFIRVCEIDVLTLDPHGVCSFDAKQILRKINSQQASMQRPAFLFNPKESYYFVTGSTSHDKTSHNQAVIHISNLHKGRDVFQMKDKHEWTPSTQDLEDLMTNWMEATNGILEPEIWKWMDKTTSFTNNIKDYYEEKIGISWELLAQFLFNKQVNPVEAMLLNYPFEGEQKDELIRLSIEIQEWIVDNLQKKVDDLQKKVLRSKYRDKEHKTGLKDGLKKSKSLRTPELKKRLIHIIDKEVTYIKFNKSLREEGIRTKGIQAKIETITEEMGWKFEMKGKIMISSTAE